MIYRNRNGFKNTFRYRKVDNNTNDYVGIINSKRIIKYTETENTNGKSFHYVPYDYHPRWFFKIIWSIQSWYKRPRKKPNKTISKTKTISKRLSNSVGIVLLAVIGTILSAIIWLEYKEHLLKVWRMMF